MVIFYHTNCRLDILKSKGSAYAIPKVGYAIPKVGYAIPKVGYAIPNVCMFKGAKNGRTVD